MKLIASLMIVAMVAVPASAASVLFTDGFDYTPAGATLHSASADWSQDTDGGKADVNPMTIGADLSSIEQNGGQSQTAAVERAWAADGAGFTDGKVYVALTFKVHDASQVTWSKSRQMRMTNDGNPTVGGTGWQDSFFKIVSAGAGSYQVGVAASGGDVLASAVLTDGAFGATHTAIWETDLDNDTVSLYLDQGLDPDLVGAADATVTSNANTLAGVAFIEYGHYPSWSVYDLTASYVPEPATMALLGLGGLGALIRRRR